MDTRERSWLSRTTTFLSKVTILLEDTRVQLDSKKLIRKMMTGVHPFTLRNRLRTLMEPGCDDEKAAAKDLEVWKAMLRREARLDWESEIRLKRVPARNFQNRNYRHQGHYAKDCRGPKSSLTYSRRPNTGSFNRKKGMRDYRGKTRARKAEAKTVSFSEQIQNFPVETADVSCKATFYMGEHSKGCILGAAPFLGNAWHAQVLQPPRNWTPPLPNAAPLMSGARRPTSRSAYSVAQLQSKNETSKSA